jgi:hypothetical protein
LNTLFGLSQKHQQVEREEQHQVKLHKVTQVNLDSIRMSLRWRKRREELGGSGERDDGSRENLNTFFGLGIQTTAQPMNDRSGLDQVQVMVPSGVSEDSGVEWSGNGEPGSQEAQPI